MGKSFLPAADHALLAWSANFSTLISAGATSYGLTTTQATAYASLHSAFSTAMAAVDPGVRNKAAVLTKENAKAALKANARVLAKIVEATPTVTDTQKATLGLNVRAMPSPIPVPPVAPVLDVISVIGRTVKIHLHQPEGGGRGKPSGVAQAYVFSYVGATAPADPSQYDFMGGATRTTFDVAYPPTVAGGARVWLTACWVNPRGQSGPACEPVGTYLQGAASAAA